MYCSISVELVRGQWWTYRIGRVGTGAEVDCTVSAELVVGQLCTVAY